jgi:hypothetical protein
MSSISIPPPPHLISASDICCYIILLFSTYPLPPAGYAKFGPTTKQRVSHSPHPHPPIQNTHVLYIIGQKRLPLFFHCHTGKVSECFVMDIIKVSVPVPMKTTCTVYNSRRVVIFLAAEIPFLTSQPCSYPLTDKIMNSWHCF